MSRPIDLRQDTESVAPRVPKKVRRGRPKWGSTFWARGIIPQRSDLCPFAGVCKSHYCDKPTGHNRCQVIEQYRNWAIRQYAQQDHIKDHHLPMVFNFVQAQMICTMLHRVLSTHEMFVETEKRGLVEHPAWKLLAMWDKRVEAWGKTLCLAPLTEIDARKHLPPGVDWGDVVDVEVIEAQDGTAEAQAAEASQADG